MGYQGRLQYISLGDGCWYVGTAAHEIGKFLALHLSTQFLYRELNSCLVKLVATEEPGTIFLKGWFSLATES